MDDQAVEFPAGFFGREDESPDDAFYDWPRKVVHIDDGAIAALGRCYAELLPSTGVLLDLMSSWRTHLPESLAANPGLTVVGLGMNAEEMADNSQLDRYLVHDLNAVPELPFKDASFDGAMCAVSVQYMTRPVEIFREVARVLKSGAPFVASFSNRCFPTKAVAAWLAGSDAQHIDIVRAYLRRSGGWADIHVSRHTPEWDDPLFAVRARRG